MDDESLGSRHIRDSLLLEHNNALLLHTSVVAKRKKKCWTHVAKDLHHDRSIIERSTVFQRGTHRGFCCNGRTTARHYNQTVLLYASLYYFDILFDHHQSVRSGDQKIYHHSVSHKKKQVVKTKNKKNDCKTTKQDKDKKRKNQPWVTQSQLYHHLRL